MDLSDFLRRAMPWAGLLACVAATPTPLAGQDQHRLGQERELRRALAVQVQGTPWELILDGNVFVQYLYDGSDRGLRQFGSVNWFTGTARRRVANGWFALGAGLSLERLTVGLCGYPDLLQSGELCQGAPLHDQQHPHNLFMELAARYRRPVVGGVGLEVYGGVAGEPALGPEPHQISALSNPLAPISHHWLDASHVSFGVVTVGVSGRRWRLEGSVFNGREPGEERFGIHLAPLDSYSGRLWLLPDEHWSFQISAGHLRQAELVILPTLTRADVNRITASLTHHRPLGRGLWATTAAWGQNGESHLGRYYRTNALLLESSVSLAEHDILFGRAEQAQKQGEDLALFGALQHRTFPLRKLQAGYTHQFGAPQWRLLPGVGASVSLSLVPGELTWLYVRRQPFGLAVFGSLRPAAMTTHVGR